MSNLIVLIDPNDENLENLIKEVNLLKPNNVWVGCSVSSGNDVEDVFNSLNVPANLYPGNFDQIQKGHGLARKVYISDPLFYSNPEITTLFDKVTEYSKVQFPDKLEFMNYILLHPNCAAARVLGVTNSYGDDEVLSELDIRTMHPQIYLEGGSRNKNNSIIDGYKLVKKITEKYPQNRIICGGGISTPRDVSLLKELDVDIVVSNAIHSNPRMLEKYMKLFE